MGYVYRLDRIPAGSEGLAGGKALSLARMSTALNVNVPSGYVITSDAFESGKIKDEALGEIEKLIASLDRKYTYAVRSSARSEDGKNASFAGQYETVTDVEADGILAAVREVAASEDNSRVREYSGSVGGDRGGIAVVIQRFIKAEFSGVVFTSDVMNGRDDKLIGNYVRGEGEKLVSGAENAKEFRIDAFDLSYEGDPEFAPYARKLGKYCNKIRDLYKGPTDIEWAAGSGKVYILQARPVTTLRRLDPDTYDINGSRSGYKLLTRTNVGEIFMHPVTPMTFSVLEKINDILGMPDWLDNICGQAYMNISVMCSVAVAFGKTREKAFEDIRELAGNIPEGIQVPVSPFDKKAMIRKIFKLFFPKERSKLGRKQKHEMVRDLASICRQKIGKIRLLDSNEELLSYWKSDMLPALNDGLASIMAESGMSLLPLFTTRKKFAKIAGEELADRLCGGCVGVIDCMKPVLLLEDVIAGRMTREEYIDICGHRCADEMELSAPRPYEDPEYIECLIRQRSTSGSDLYSMREQRRKDYENALAEFRSKYPRKSRWADKKIASFVHANDFREDIRSKGVWIFSVFREFLLKAGAVNGIGDDIFMLTMPEVFALIEGDVSSLRKIDDRKNSYERYCSYPVFPMVVLGRFDPERWIGDPDRSTAFYCEDMDEKVPDEEKAEASVKGFAGARGKVTGRVKVITDIKDIDQIEERDILVTVATNIGWTMAFPHVSAVVTDVGAPLSHAAIVAREFGIPAVVGCGNATSVLKTGDMVEVDGAKGTVRIIKK